VGLTKQKSSHSLLHKHFKSWRQLSLTLSDKLYSVDNPEQSAQDFICLFVFGGTGGVQSQGFTLAKQELYQLTHTSSPFCSGFLGDGVL
jgi:hypothetical protein